MAVHFIADENDVIQFIEAERVRLGISERSLCAQAGLSHSALWYIKNSGAGHLKASTALRLIAALGGEVKIKAVR